MGFSLVLYLIQKSICTLVTMSIKLCLMPFLSNRVMNVHLLVVVHLPQKL